MKTLIHFILFLFSGTMLLNGQPVTLSTKVYSWEEMTVEKTATGEKREILEGKTPVLDYLEIHVTSLNPGNAPHGSHVHADMEELIIVKEGVVEQSINGKKKILGPGSVVLALPGDDHGIRNAGETVASYYIIRWKTNGPVNTQRKEESGGSVCYDWNDIAFQKTAKGGKRQFMQRPTALLSELEMHVTTLGEGVTSHAEHVHSNEEIILMIRGEGEESIQGVPHRMTPGSFVLLTDNVPHGIRNAGKGQCEYFAFKWVK